MELLSSEQRSLALDILFDIQSAIERLQARTKRIHTIDDFLDSSDGMILLDATCMLLIAIGFMLSRVRTTSKSMDFVINIYGAKIHKKAESTKLSAEYLDYFNQNTRVDLRPMYFR